MTLACFSCKRFIAEVRAVRCSGVQEHIFHPDCLKTAGRSQLGELARGACLPCHICEAAGSSASLSKFSRLPGNAGSECSSPTASEGSSTQDLLRALLDKVSGIELQLGGIAAICARLDSLELSVRQAVAVQGGLMTRVDGIAADATRLGAVTSRIQRETAELGKRVGALEDRAVTEAGGGVMARLESLEREKLSSELILFGVKERTSKSVRETIREIGAALGMDPAMSDCRECYRTPAKGDKPRPIVLQLASREHRREWLNRKRAVGNLEGAAVAADLSGSRILVNERLPAQARELFREARRCVEDGRLFRAWTRDGRVFVRRAEASGPVGLHDLAHLRRAIEEGECDRGAALERAGLAGASDGMPAASASASRDESAGLSRDARESRGDRPPLAASQRSSNINNDSRVAQGAVPKRWHNNNNNGSRNNRRA